MRKIFMNVEDYLDIVMYGNPEYEGLSEEAPRSPGSIAELLRELEQGGHLPLDSGKEGEEETP